MRRLDARGGSLPRWSTGLCEERRLTVTKSLLQTEVPGFDTVLGGGIPQRQTLLITGQPGSGKTVLASQVAFQAAAKGMRVVMATTTSESQTKLLDDLAGFSFFSQQRLGEELFFLSIYPWLKKGAREAKDVLLNTVRERKAGLLVIDGLRSIRDLWQDEAKLREFFYELAVGLAASDCTAILITEYPLQRLIDFAESTTVDGIVALSLEERGPRRVRRAEVVKLRGMRHLSGQHVMNIGTPGVRVFPRLEATIVPDVNHAPSDARATFGLPEGDALLKGGVPSPSSILVAGGAGIGKTLLGLHFAAAGARNGEHAFVLTFTEPRAGLVARARRVNLDLQPSIDRGLLDIEYQPGLELEADELVEWTFERMAARGTRRLVFEDVDELERRLGDPERASGFLAAMLIRLRQAGITSLFTRKISKLVGPELDFSDTALAAMAENLFFLRHVELRGRLHRILSIVNLRDSGFDPSLREFEIRDDGLRVRGAFDSVEGLLTGQARPLTTGSPSGDP
jgi:circadian clock protein KaiC